MRQDGSNNRGSETIWRTKGKNLEEKEKIYGAQDENLWRTTPDKDQTTRHRIEIWTRVRDY